MTERSKLGFELNSTLEQTMLKTPPESPVLKACKKNDLINLEKDNQITSLKDEIEEINLEKDNQITSLKDEIEEIKEDGLIDSLTGCYIRKYWENFSSNFNPNTDRVAMVNIDVDGLGIINDSLGHPAGDEYLKKVADYLRKVLNDPEDKIIRMGGDEFLVLSQKGKNSHESYNHFKEFINDSFSQEKLQTEGIYISHGITHFTNKLDRNVEDTYERSDNKMYFCKNSKKLESV